MKIKEREIRIAEEIDAPKALNKYGIDFVTPFQGWNLFWRFCSQGVALGCYMLRFQREVLAILPC